MALALPRPPSASAEDLAARDRTAIAQLTELRPANAVEADLAVHCVAAQE